MDCSTSDVLLRVANMARTRPSWQIWLGVYLLVSSRKKGVPIKGKCDNKVVAKFLQVVPCQVLQEVIKLSEDAQHHSAKVDNFRYNNKGTPLRPPVHDV